MNDTKLKLKKGIKYLSITLPLLFLAPFFMFLGFRAINRNREILGYFLVPIGFIIGLFAIGLMILGIKNLLDYLFEK